MGWLDNVDADMAAFASSTDDGAVSVVVYPHEAPTTASSAFYCLIAEPTSAHITDLTGEQESQRAELTGYRTTISAAINGVTGYTRNLERGDKVTIASGEFAGDWVAETDAIVDAGGGVRCDLIRPRRSRVGGSRAS